MMGEVLGVEMVPADPTNYRAGERDSYSKVVIHVTDGHADPRPVAEMWQQAHHGSSAHFVVGQDGTILQTVHLVDIAYHAHAANAYSVGIEHCARSPGELGSTDPGLPVSDAQYQASARLVAYLCRAAGLEPTRDTIRGHCEIDLQTTHQDCPNKIWDWGRYMQLVADESARLAQAA